MKTNTQKREAPLKSGPPFHRLSVVIPLYNESPNVAPLLNAVHAALDSYPFPWELIVVDDGSFDETLQELEQLQGRYGAHLRIVALQRNFGQTAAMQAGIDAARGDIIATLDGDLQNDPHDIPQMVARLFAADLDLLAGWRRNRKDRLFLRKIPSWLANRIIRRVTGVNLHDYGCTLKIFRSDVIKRIRLYGEMHRFIPAWMTLATSPSRIAEIPVRHLPRRHGKSKYGLMRAFYVLLDLLSVYFFMNHRAKPGHFFGTFGLIFGFLGSMILAYLGVVKFILGQDIGTRPLLLVGVLFIIAAIQFLTTGVVAELMARTYFESSDSKPYTLRTGTRDADPAPDAGWHPGRANGRISPEKPY